MPACSVSKNKPSCAYNLLHVGFLLCLLLYHEDVEATFSSESVDIQRAARRYILENITRHNDCYENIKSYTFRINSKSKCCL
jgi:hypothetical protein